MASFSDMVKTILNKVKLGTYIRIKLMGCNKVYCSTQMWHFGPCVTFRPCQCHFYTCQCDFSALRLFPASGTLPCELKKIHRNNRRNTQTQVSSTYSLGSSFHNIWIATGPCIQSGEGVHWRERQNQKAPTIVSKRGFYQFSNSGAGTAFYLGFASLE